MLTCYSVGHSWRETVGNQVYNTSSHIRSLMRDRDSTTREGKTRFIEIQRTDNNTGSYRHQHRVSITSASALEHLNQKYKFFDYTHTAIVSLSIHARAGFILTLIYVLYVKRWWPLEAHVYVCVIRRRDLARGEKEKGAYKRDKIM